MLAFKNKKQGSERLTISISIIRFYCLFLLFIIVCMYNFIYAF